MKSVTRKFCCVLFIFSNVYVSTSVPALADTADQLQSNDEHIVWQRTPIEITLPVGKERFVSFPQEVQFGYNKERLPENLLRVENDHQTLYLLAKQPFNRERTEAKLSNGDIVLLDMSAKTRADDFPIDIVLPNVSDFKKNPQDNNEVSNADTVNYVSLIRYAMQQLYAPDEFLTQSNVMTRFPMEAGHVVSLFLDGSATAMPLASWQGDDFYVTALMIKNLLQQSLPLDPRLLCGSWKAASFYPQRILSPQGATLDQDSTTLFLVSDRPFADSIKVCIN